MAMPSSQIKGEMGPELHDPVMPVDLFKAAIKGDSEHIDEMLVNKEDSDSVKSELRSATLFGDTILHLLITEGHNELALKVFKYDESLLKARNNQLETPLYCAVKVGNTYVIDELMKSNCAVVKDVVAALQFAIFKGYTVMVQRMLDVNTNLACTPFPDGMFPIHEAARMGHLDLVMLIIQKYPVDDAELRDLYGRNFFHIAAEENKEEFFNIGEIEEKYFEGNYDLRLQQWREMIERMIIAQNYEGNTPFHSAAMKGNRKIMKAIWELYKDAKTGPTPFELKNKQSYTPLQLSAKQVLKTNKDIDNDMINEYLETHEDYKFSEKWFHDFMEPPLANKWERTQVIGLGSVLITTVTFAAAFTMPGGYNQDHGTPVLGRKYMFRAFILANSLAFIQGFLSLFALIFQTLRYPSDNAIVFATMSFLVAAGSMVVAFGLGMYVTLALVCLPIAILLLIITLFLGTPAVILVVGLLKSNLGPTMNSTRWEGSFILLAFYGMSFLFVFGLAFV